MLKHIPTLILGLAVIGYANAGSSLRFAAYLDGFNAAGAPVATNATGQAKVEVIDDGTALAFQLNVAGIDNLLMAHIHVAPVPVEITDPAGPVAYWFVAGPPPGNNLTETVNGRLAGGFIITDGEVTDWDPVDTPDSGTVAGLIRAIEEGRASVVVHTDDLDPNTPTGAPGDSRAGGLRGTLR